MQHQQSIGVSACIIAQGKVLLLKRSAQETFLSGYWELPGGRVEFGEDPYVALAREVKEETKLEILVKRPYYLFSYQIGENQHVVDIQFHCTLLKNTAEIVLSKEHSQARWVPLGDVDAYQITDMMKQAVKQGFHIDAIPRN